ncbi:hypothetical protein TNCV_4204481 [Trichonephila clavipes]|nr:hypothetical protein TNCV_4204481 [Trichonephila clavipes]
MHLSATPRWSDSSQETSWREDAEQLRYAPPHWSCARYYGMERYWMSLSHYSSTHSLYFKQPALHLRGVGVPKGTKLTRRGFRATNRSFGKQSLPRPVFY